MDIFYRHLNSKKIAVFIALTGCVLMVVLPEITLLSAQKGISLWAGSVLPALLPFFICTGFMNSLGITRFLPQGIFVFSMSVLSGYPMGARLIGEMVRGGEMDTCKARRLIAFSSTSGPAFILGTVGIAMLGSTKAGIAAALAHYAGAVATGLIFSAICTLSEKKAVYMKQSVSDKKCRCKSEKEKNGEILVLFTDAILGALKSLGIILAYIVIFMFITDIIQFSGILNVIHEPHIKAIVKGIFEMTVGCSALTPLSFSLSAKTVMATFLISFGGLSIIGQSMSMLSGSGISLIYFLMVKICHGFVSAGIAYILCPMIL